MTHPRVFAAVLCGFLLAGCGLLSAPQQDTFYRLPPAPVPGEAAANSPLVHVPPFSANSLLSERALVYARADGTALEQYNYHFWVDSPRMLLQQALADHLRATLPARVVLEAAAEARYTVRGHIVKFERAAGDGATAQVSLRFEVYAAGAELPVFSRAYDRVVDPPDDNVAACVAALGAASQEILAQFALDLRAQLGS